jgi:hypothetical protein
MRGGTLKATASGRRVSRRPETSPLSPRRQLDFDCPAHHRFTIVFSDEAQLPTSWECPTCWASALRSDGVPAVVPVAKPVRTHWDMLRERRSVAELEETLAERLALLKSGAIGPNAYERIAVARHKAA